MTNIIQKLDYIFDFEEIKRNVLSIIEEHNLLQIGLTHSDKDLTEEEKIIDCVGSLYNYDTREFRNKETDFTQFNEKYKNTYLYEVYKNLPNIGRVRIMTMNGPSCYTIHRDLTKRYHYAIETNKDCLFLFPSKEQQFHIPCDRNMYLVDTRNKHTFVNGSRKRRIHLVLDDLTDL